LKAILKNRVIVVAADFVEENPFFALQEYVAYADQEIKPIQALDSYKINRTQ